MSELEKREDFSRYEAMSTEELQEILRKHAHGELQTEPDTEELFKIMEVLSNRRQQQPSLQAFRSDAEALTEFREYYMPKEDEKKARPVQFPVRFLKTVAAVLAVMLALAAGVTVTAEAFHVDIWGKVANWTQEIFQFTDAPQGTTVANPDRENNVELKSLQDALAKEKIREKLVPTWLPEGYKSKDFSVMRSPKERTFYAIYKNNELELIIRIRQTIGVQASQVEKSADLLEIYTANGVDYYIFSNNATLQAAWSVGEFECIILGKITLEEMKGMIDSI